MTKKKTSIKVMEFDKWLGNQGVLGQRGTYTAEDDIDGIMRDAQKMKVQRLKTMELDKYLLQSEQELEKLKRGELLTSNGGPLPSNADFLNMAKALEDLSPDEAQRVRSSYTFFKMAEKGGSGGMALMPMLLQYAKTNPGASEDQMINYLKLMDSQLMKGLEIAKAMNPPKQGDPMNYMVKGMELMKATNPPKQDNPMEFLKLMKDLVIEGVRNPLLQAIEKSQPTPGVFEQILTKPELYSRFKEIGMFGSGDGAAKGTIDLEIEKLRGDRDLQNRKFELEMQKMVLDNQNKERRTEMILKSVLPFASMFAGPIDERMREMGRQSVNPVFHPNPGHNPNPKPAPNPGPSPSTLSIVCDECGYDEEQSFMGPPPETVTCPRCSNEMNIVLKMEDQPDGR